MKRILTGDNTTGNLHLGHLVGSIQNRVKYQKEYETFIILADTHALAYPKFITTDYSLRSLTREVLLDNISCGLDPEKVTFFAESDVPEIFQIATIFSNFVTFSRNMRNPTIKQEIIEKSMEDNYSMGFLNFPILMASDILSVRADVVPVGEDQKPMIELARDIVERINNTFDTDLKMPEEILGDVPRLVGLDGNVKMTKSLGNCVYLTDSPQVVREKIMKMYTDPSRIRATDPGKVEGNPVFIYHDAFNKNKDEVLDLKDRYRLGKIGDVEVKEKLFTCIELILEPIRQRRSQFEKMDVEEVLRLGAAKTTQEASKTLQHLKEKILR